MTRRELLSSLCGLPLLGIGAIVGSAFSGERRPGSEWSQIDDCVDRFAAEYGVTGHKGISSLSWLKTELRKGPGKALWASPSRHIVFESDGKTARFWEEPTVSKAGSDKVKA